MTLQEYPFFIGNKKETSNEKLEVINPYDKNAIGYIYLAGLNHVKNALEIALEIQPAISKIKFAKKVNLLEKFYATILERNKEFEDLIVRESGKTVASAKSELQNSLLFIKKGINFSTELERRGFSYCGPSYGSKGTDFFVMSKRDPSGTMLAINSFRYPLFSITKKIVLSILSSSPAIIFPSLETPLLSLQIGFILETMEIPNGWISILSVPKAIIKEAITDNSYASLWIEDEDIIEITTELSINHNIVLDISKSSCAIIDSVENYDECVNCCIQSSFSFSGQTKNNVKQLYINEAIYHNFVTSFVKIASKLKVGDPISPKSDIGPVINSKSVDGFLEFLNWSKKSNFRIISGGEIDQNLIKPTIVINPAETLEGHKEINRFPVLILESYSNLENTITKILRQKFWGSLAIFSNDLKNSFLLSRFGLQDDIYINKIPDEFNENNSIYYIEDIFNQITRRRNLTVYPNPSESK